MGMLDILQHALGVDRYGRGERYRNHFVTDEGSTDWPECVRAVDLGLMTRRESLLCGGYSVFIVTDQGQRYVDENSPPAPKRTAAQRRYEAWLNADWFPGTFADWLKSPYANRRSI